MSIHPASCQDIHSQPPPGYSLREAAVEDAEAIYQIKVQAFGMTSLHYTIYQAPESILYLQKLIAGGSAQGHYFTVIQAGRKVFGYYHAVKQDSTFFLNYIAVASDARGLSLGNALFGHFEAAGRQAGCQALTLEVFESNRVGMNWYLAREYRPIAAGFHLQIAVDLLDSDCALPLRFAQTDWAEAQAKEREYGFSRLECACGSGTVMLGIIGQRLLKLLSWSGISFQEAVQAIAGAFHSQRPILIVSFAPDFPSHWPVLRQDRVQRLSKS